MTDHIQEKSAPWAVAPMALRNRARPPLRLACGPCMVRDWRPTDLPALVALANNRRIWRNLHHRFPHPYTEADARHWFALLAAMPEPTHWAVELDGVAVGGVGVDPGEGIYAKAARFGYWLGEPYWGRGLMSKVARAASAHALDRFDLVRLEATVFAWNPASMRVLEKAGFVREGVLRRSAVKDGQVVDQVVYALVRTDFQGEALHDVPFPLKGREASCRLRRKAGILTLSRRSPDAAQRNPGICASSTGGPRIPACGLHPGYVG